MADQTKRGTFIHGIAASEHLDSSGERIQIEGVDITSLTKDGVFNYEHNSKEASSIVGKILEAKKILKASDCESDHHKYFWDKIKMPFIYVAGELFDAVGHKEASEVAAMVRYDQLEQINKDAKRLINFSIEGSRVEKQGAIITKCIARKISITLTPCNKVCEAEELKIDPKEEKHSDSGKFSFIQDIMSKADEPSCQIMKGEIPFIYKNISDMAPKAPKAPVAPKPSKPKVNIARPDKGFGAIVDKTPKTPAKPNYGKVIIKGKKTPVTMTAEQAVDEHEKLVDVLESPSKKDDKKEAKKQRKELKEYKEKLDKAEKKIHPKDPVLNYDKVGPKALSEKQQKDYEARVKAMNEKTKVGKKETEQPIEKATGHEKGVHMPIPKNPKGGTSRLGVVNRLAGEYHRAGNTHKEMHALADKIVQHKKIRSEQKKIKPNLPKSEFLYKKKKLSKYDSNVRKALTASCGLGASPAAKTQGEAIVKNEPRRPLPRPSFFDDHKGLIPKNHPDHEKALHHIHQEHMKGNKVEARRLHDRYITGGGSLTIKSEIRKIMKDLGNQAFDRFEKKEELLKFLSERLPKLSSKEIRAIAKAVAYNSEKKKEEILEALMEQENG